MRTSESRLFRIPQCIALDNVACDVVGNWAHRGRGMRTALRSNEAAQGLFKLIAAFGDVGYQAAVLLVKNEFDLTRAALELGITEFCEKCAIGATPNQLRGCPVHTARLRQRVHRLEERVQAMLGERMPVTRHVRATVVYGADRVSDGRSTLYETMAGSLETGDPTDLDGPEGE